MKMNAVEAGALRARGRRAEIGNNLFHLGVRHLHRRPREDGVRYDRRRQRYDLGYQRLAAGMAQFSEDNAAAAMHCVGDPGEGTDASVVIQAELPRLILSTRLDVDMPGYDQAGAAARQIGIEADQIVGGIALARRHGFGRRRADDPVLENEASDLSRNHE